MLWSLCMTHPARHSTFYSKFKVNNHFHSRLFGSQKWKNSADTDHPENDRAMNSSAKHCIESTLSKELSNFQLSAGTFAVLLGVCITNGVLSILAVLENSLVVLLILKYRDLQTNSNILIFTLALTDILVGLVVQPAFGIYIAGKLKIQFFCKALITYLYTETFCVGLSLITLSVISCERYFAIFYPYKYVSIVTKAGIIKLVALIWASWLAFNVVCRALRVKNDEFFTPVACVVIGLCLFLNIIVYFKIYRVIRHHARQIRAQMQVQLELQTTQDQAVASPVSREDKMAKTVAYISLLVTLCYTPLFLTSLADLLLDKDELFDHVIYPVAETIAFMNSSLNPVVYCWRCQDIQKKMKDVLGCLTRVTTIGAPSGNSNEPRT